MKSTSAISLQQFDAGPMEPPSASSLPAVVAACVVMLAAASGCTVVTVGAAVVSTAAAVTVGVASTAVDVGVGAAKVTGKVIGKGVDAITPSSPAKP